MKALQGELAYRPAVLADVAHLVMLVNSAYRGESSRAGWTTEADLLDGQRTDADEISLLINAKNAMILLALKGDEIVGSVQLQQVRQFATLGMLVIKPGMQGLGWGKKFMQAAEATAIKIWGVKKIRLHVITLRPELIAFYERRGYRRSGIVKAFPKDVRFGMPKVNQLEIEMMEKSVLSSY
jgi:ribosomal protein S18 acetylase RimI-like enzyme